jgi:hypothetical protein
MNPRNAFLLSMATTYMLANLDDVCLAFEDEDNPNSVEHGGITMVKPSERELREIRENLKSHLTTTNPVV